MLCGVASRCSCCEGHKHHTAAAQFARGLHAAGGMFCEHDKSPPASSYWLPFVPNHAAVVALGAVAWAQPSMLSRVDSCSQLLSCRPEVELEYKYVVRNEDGGVMFWKPGENCQIKVPVWLKEEKAIAEGVLVRDAWDGSIQDIELEVTGFQRQEFTEEEERAAVQSAVSSSSALWLAGAMLHCALRCQVLGLACLCVACAWQ